MREQTWIEQRLTALEQELAQVQASAKQAEANAYALSGAIAILREVLAPPAETPTENP